MAGDVRLGVDVQTGEGVWLSGEARKLSSYVVGAQGSGKSNLLMQIALGDIQNGDGVCYITPHPDIEEILMRIPAEREQDVIVFAPHTSQPIGLNVFERVDPRDIASIGAIADNVVMGTFELLWGESWGAQMEEFLRHVTLTILYSQTLLLEKRPTLAEFAEVIEIDKDPKYRNSLLSHIEKNLETYEIRVPIEALLKFWRQFAAIRGHEQEHLLRSTLNKARLWRTNPIVAHVVGQYENKLDLTDLMNRGKILLVDLDEERVGEDNVSLLASLLAGQLYLAALRRPNNPAKQFHIIADEFGYYASKAFANLQDRTGKRGLDVLVAHQRRNQLTEETRSSTLTATNWIIFRVNPDDARDLAGGFSSAPPKQEISGQREHSVYAINPWDVLAHQGHDNSEIAELVFQISEYLRVGKQITTVDSIQKFTELNANLQKHEEEAEATRKAKLNMELRRKQAEQEEERRAKEVERLRGFGEMIGWSLTDAVLNIGRGPYGEVERVSPGFPLPWDLWTFPDQDTLDEFELNLNHTLYQLMTTDAALYLDTPNIETPVALLRDVERFRSQLQWFGLNIFRYRKVERYDNETHQDEDEWEKIEPNFLPSEGLCLYILGIIYQADAATLKTIRNTKQYADIPKWDDLMSYGFDYIQMSYRVELMGLIARLGKLLRQQPVWVRGGQPEPHEEHPRAYSDVAKEWENSLTQLKGYTAWARIQDEDKSFKTCLIQPEKLPDAPTDGVERARRIRERSAKKYGVPRPVVDRWMRERVDPDRATGEPSDVLGDRGY